MVKQEQQASSHLLLLDAGDSLFGDRFLGQQTQGKGVVEAMNLLGYDAMALGGGDMRLGLDTLRQRMAEAEFPFLSANVVLSGTETLFTEPYVIKEMGDHRVAIIGLTEPGAADAVEGGVTVLNPIETARRYVAEVSSKASVIIVLSHIGVEENIKLAEEVEGIDLIVSGAGQVFPGQAVQNETTGALIVQAEVSSPGHAGRMVGVARLQIDSQGEIKGHQWAAVSLAPDFADDPEMRALLSSD
ncbi:MAG: bifunctional metallophosphatase/5'-nucleotidase [Anaerolineales bacterium]|nr:MAG: bifunctional metallophosphatase/5'-nucleotidase [Anaerolineales bacterium]